jgi:hypothetical protein
MRVLARISHYVDEVENTNGCPAYASFVKRSIMMHLAAGNLTAKRLLFLLILDDRHFSAHPRVCPKDAVSLTRTSNDHQLRMAQVQCRLNMISIKVSENDGR